MYDAVQYESPAEFLIAGDIIVINHRHMSIIQGTWDFDIPNYIGMIIQGF